MSKIIVKLEIDTTDWDLENLDLKHFEHDIRESLRTNLLRGSQFEITECKIEEDNKI